MAEKHEDQMCPAVNSLTALVRLLLFCRLWKNWSVNLFNNLRKQRNITMGEAAFWCKPKIVVLDKNLSPYQIYSGRYWIWRIFL